MADDFFKETPQEVPVETPVEKIKLGEDEYTQEELQKLVGLGKIGMEAETKYKTKIDKVWPKFQQTINEKRELQEQFDKFKTERTQPQQPANPASQEAIRAEAVRQARDLGLVTKEDVFQLARQIAVETQQGQRLIDDISSTIDTMKEDGLPATTVEEVIQHMQETGIKNPEKAYKDMFESEWIKNQTDKLNTIRSKGMPTLSRSTAGSKLPASVKPTNSNLESLVSEALNVSYQ